MATVFDERVGVVTATVAFVAAALEPFRHVLRGDLVGPLGGIPPLAVDVAGLVLGPVLAITYGYRVGLVSSRSLRRLATRVGVGALVGATLGGLVGWVVSRVVVFGTTLALARLVTLGELLSLLVEPLFTLPVALAVGVGVVGGIVVGRVIRDLSRPAAHQTADSESGLASASRAGLTVIAAVCGVVAGFAVVMQQFDWLLTAAWTGLSDVQYGLLASVVVPLVAVGSAALVGTPPTTHRHLETVVSSAVIGTTVGSMAAFGYAITVERILVSELLASIQWRLAVDIATVSAVVAVATLAGSAYPQWFGEEATEEPTA